MSTASLIMADPLERFDEPFGCVKHSPVKPAVQILAPLIRINGAVGRPHTEPPKRPVQAIRINDAWPGIGAITLGPDPGVMPTGAEMPLRESNRDATDASGRSFETRSGLVTDDQLCMTDRCQTR